jgi:hypothetical protein
VYEAAIDLKREHPKWGAQFIRIHLQRQYPQQALPSVRTLQRWFRAAGVARTPSVRQQRSGHIQRGQQVHAVWAVDAKEGIHLADGSVVSWLVMTDEASGAVLEAAVFPPGKVDAG